MQFDIPVPPLDFIQKGCIVTGTNAGSLQDVQEAFGFAKRGQVRVKVQSFEMDQAAEVFKEVVSPCFVFRGRPWNHDAKRAINGSACEQG